MADDGQSGGQDICNFFASFINQRQQVERLLNWLRDSQTVCTDSNCFDEINGLPGSEQGGSLLPADELPHQQAADENGLIAMIMCLVLGFLTIYAMNLNRDRQQEDPQAAKGARRPPDDDHGLFRRRDGDNNDRNTRPAI